jgi:hypothetical protein
MSYRPLSGILSYRIGSGKTSTQRWVTMENIKVALWQTGIVVYWFWLKCLLVFAIHAYLKERKAKKSLTPVNLYGFIVKRKGNAAS